MEESSLLPASAASISPTQGAEFAEVRAARPRNTGSVQTVALVTQDGSESERLEDLVAPSHVNTQVDRTVRTLDWISFTGFILELV